jgi:D-inositol-3-phosphate glycosyltransferase
MKKLLWVGDAAVSSGFARATHGVLDVLKETWEITVLGLNYIGDPHPYPYDIYPCWPGGDAFGLGRLNDIAGGIQPDVIVFQNDTWNVPGYLAKLQYACKKVAVMPVDGKNVASGKKLNDLDLGIFWTHFGLNEARKGGFTQRGEVIPLGVDLDIYKPVDRMAARQELGLPKKVMDAFIIGNINRNQPRKRLDLTIQTFARWVREYQHDDAYLFLYVAPTGDSGYDCTQLMHYYGFSKGSKRLILVEPHLGHGYKEEALKYVYSSFDVQISTTQGEGWGLTTLEGMACGIPQLIPDWAALGEWAAPAAVTVECTSEECTPNGINVIGGVADIGLLVDSLEMLYTHAETRDKLRDAGLALAAQPEYRWDAIGRQFAEALKLL